MLYGVGMSDIATLFALDFQKHLDELFAAILLYEENRDFIILSTFKVIVYIQKEAYISLYLRLYIH